MKTERAYVPCTFSTGDATNKPECSKFIDAYVSYSGWEHCDADFTKFKDVFILCSLEEATFTETLSCLRKDMPNGSTIISSYKRKVLRQQQTTQQPMEAPAIVKQQPTPAMSEQQQKQELGGLIQLLMISQHMTYEAALASAMAEMQKRKNGTRAANNAQTTVTTSSTTASPAATVPSSSQQQQPQWDVVDMVDVEITKTIGPFNKGARFDVMLFDILTKEGIFHRNNSDKYYTVSFNRGKNNTDRVPRLVRECTKQRAPAYF
jgi:hypothetical protein